MRCHLHSIFRQAPFFVCRLSLYNGAERAKVTLHVFRSAKVSKLAISVSFNCETFSSNDVKCKSPKMEMTEFEKAVWSIDFHFRKVTVLGVSTLGLCNSRSNKTAEWSYRPMSTDDNWDANEPFVSTRSSVWPLQCVGHVTNCEKLKQSHKDRNPFDTAVTLVHMNIKVPHNKDSMELCGQHCQKLRKIRHKSCMRLIFRWFVDSSNDCRSRARDT